MVKPKEPLKAEPTPRRTLGKTGIYLIKKFGQHEYQVYRFDPNTRQESPCGIANTYGVVAGDLIDKMYAELSGGSL